MKPPEVQRLTEILARLRSWQENPVYSINRITEVTGLSRTRIRQLIDDGKFTVAHGDGARSILLSSVVNYFSGRLAKRSGTGKLKRRATISTGRK